MQRIAIIFSLSIFLFSCDMSKRGVHEYKLSATVSEVMSCNKQTKTCQAKVYKGDNAEYNEIWTIKDLIKKGDKVQITCRFQIAKIKKGDDKTMSAGLSSRSTVEKELNNANCDKYARSD